MIRIPRHKLFAKKQLTIIGLVLACLVLVGVGAWFLLGGQAAAQYKQKMTTYRSTVATSLKSASNALKDGGDYDTRLKALNNVITAISAQATSLPAEPSVIGFSIISKEDLAVRTDFAQKLSQLKMTANDTKALVIYQHDVANILQGLAGRTGKNADEQKALAGAWLDALNTLKDLHTPTVATNFHAELLGRTSNVQATLAALPDLYAKKDATTFVAKQAELTKQIGAIHDLAANAKNAAEMQDKYLARDYQEVAKALQ